MALSLEQQREANKKQNEELLKTLFKEGDLQLITAQKAPPKPKLQKKKVAAPRKTAPAKRSRAEVEDSGDENEDTFSEPVKAARTEELPAGVRRSSRHSGKPRVSYTDEVISHTIAPPPVIIKPRKKRDADEVLEGLDINKEGRAEHVGNRLGQRTHNPKTYGSIPGVDVGTWWETRAQCSTDAIHAPFVAGISSGPKGAYSVALSGGYEDDVDLGYAFTYTGSGGRDLKGTAQNRKNLRTAPQSSDQSWDNSYNAALKKSVETKKPVRVIRGYKLDSEWAPAAGYRYDGLYTVEKAWMEPGLNASRFKVCKFALRRVPGQPPLPKRSDEDGSDDDVESQDESEAETTENSSAEKVEESNTSVEPDVEENQASDDDKMPVDPEVDASPDDEEAADPSEE